MPGQDRAEERDRPLLQRFRQQRVVRIGEGPLRDRPGLLPVHAVLVHQQPHELRHRHRRMRVVELDRELLVEVRLAGGLLQVDADHVLQRAGHQEILLDEAQALAELGLVIGIEYLGDGLAAHLAVHSAVIIAHVESLEVEGFRRLGAPQAQEIGVADAIAQNRRVVGDAAEDLVRHPIHAEPSPIVGHVLGAPAELHVEPHFAAPDLPRIAVAQPRVGHLHLPAVPDGLIEDAEFIADAVADGRDLQGGQRIHETGGQPPESAVAETGFLLLGQQLLQVEPEFLGRPLRFLPDAHVDQVVAEMGTQQEFGGQVAHRAGAHASIGRPGPRPMVQQPVANAVGQGAILVVEGQGVQKMAQDVVQIVPEGLLQRLDAQPRSRVIPGCGRVRPFCPRHRLLPPELAEPAPHCRCLASVGARRCRCDRAGDTSHVVRFRGAGLFVRRPLLPPFPSADLRHILPV